MVDYRIFIGLEISFPKHPSVRTESVALTGCALVVDHTFNVRIVTILSGVLRPFKMEFCEFFSSLMKTIKIKIVSISLRGANLFVQHLYVRVQVIWRMSVNGC